VTSRRKRPKKVSPSKSRRKTLEGRQEELLLSYDPSLSRPRLSTREHLKDEELAKRHQALREDMELEEHLPSYTPNPPLISVNEIAHQSEPQTPINRHVSTLFDTVTSPPPTQHISQTTPHVLLNPSPLPHNVNHPRNKTVPPSGPHSFQPPPDPPSSSLGNETQRQPPQPSPPRQRHQRHRRHHRSRRAAKRERIIPSDDEDDLRDRRGVGGQMMEALMSQTRLTMAMESLKSVLKEFPEKRSDVHRWIELAEVKAAASNISKESLKVVMDGLIGVEQWNQIVLATKSYENHKNLRGLKPGSWEWLKEMILLMFASKKSSLDYFKEVKERRWQLNEPVEQYLVEKQTLFWKFMDQMKQVSKSSRRTNEFLVDLQLEGMPQKVRQEVKQSTEKLRYLSQKQLAKKAKLATVSWTQERGRTTQKATTEKKKTTSHPTKSYGSKSYAKPPLKPNQCSYCRELGHWKRQCPKLQKEVKHHHVHVEEETKEVQTHGATVRPLGSEWDDVGDVEAVLVNHTKNEDLPASPYSCPTSYLHIPTDNGPVEALVDGGSEINIITEELARKLRLPVSHLRRFRINQFAANKASSGTTELKLRLCGRDDNTRDRFVVVDKNEPSLVVGLPALTRANARQDFGKENVLICGNETWTLHKRGEGEVEKMVMVNLVEEIREQEIFEEGFKKLKEKYHFLFVPHEKFTEENSPTVPVPIPVKDNKGYVEPPRRWSKYKKDCMKKLIDRDVERGILEKADTSDWVTEFVLVPKPTADPPFRMTADFRGLNKLIENDHHPLPRIDEILDRMANCRWMTKVDLDKGYHQLPVPVEDRAKTTVRSPHGCYRYKRLPLGLKHAPAQFQKRMEQVLGEELLNECASVYLDDISVYSKTAQEHLRHLERVFERLAKEKLRLNPKKVEAGKSRMSFLGYVIDKGSVKPEPRKIEAMMNMDRPESITDVRRFCGMLNFYRRFIPNFAHETAPLTDLTRKKENEKGFKWTEEAEQAFVKMKLLMCSDLVLKLVDLSKPFLVKTDASERGVGAVLKQEHEGFWHPVAYFSKKLKDSQMKWNTWVQEAYALRHAVKEWRVYLEGVKFKVETDLPQVRALMGMKEPVNKFVLNWVMYLQEFDFEIKHIPGRENVTADTLSRQFKMDMDEVEVNLAQVVDIKKLQREDKRLGVIIEFLEKEVLPTEEKMAQYVRIMSTVYGLHEGVLVFTGAAKKKKINSDMIRIAVPEVLKKEVLEECHDSEYAGHLSFSRTRARAEKKYYWDGMYNDIRRHCDTCEACYENKKQRKGKVDTLESMVITEPMAYVSLDFLGPIKATKRKKRYIIVMRDHATG